MKARARGDTSSWFGLPRWMALFLAVCLVAGAGFLLWLTAEAFSRSSTLDARRVRSLNIAADYIAKWPTVATTIGQASLYHRDKARAAKDTGESNVFFAYLYHPEFGHFQVKYDRGQSECSNDVVIDKNRMTVKGQALKASANDPEPEKTYIAAARKGSWIPLEGTNNPVCFTIANLDLRKVAPPLGTFSHLLLIEDSIATPKPDEKKPPSGDDAGTGGSNAGDGTTPKKQPTANERPNWRDGRVIGWVGQSELPIRRLSDLPALESEVSKVVVATAEATYAATTAKQAAQGRKSGASDALEPFDSRVAGKNYRFYWRPIALDVPGGSTDAGAQPVNYYLVGVAPSRAAPEPGQSRTEVLAFALVLFMLIALVPVVKLALLGPVDSMKAIEVAAICLGIVAAAALGTALLIGTRDVLVARSAASPKVATAAMDLVRYMQGDIEGALFSKEMGDLSQNLGKREADGLVVGSAPDRGATDSSPIAKVETLFLLDENGRQAAGTVIRAGRDHAGANFDVNDRIYFRRAVDEDFAPDSDRLVQQLKQKWPRLPCDIWKDIEDGLVFEQIRSRTDGAPKTIVAAKLYTPASSRRCTPKPVDTSNDERLQPSTVVTSFVMPSMLSPALEPGIRYAVVDLRNGAVGRPVLFHSDSYRAGVELFDESLDARTRARLSREIGDPVDCMPKAGARTPEARRFAGLYEEEATLFAVARVPCTDWAVVTFKSRRMVDAQAVKPAVHAIIVWASLTIIPYFAWMVAAMLLADRAWVWMWPDPANAKKEAYRKLAIGLASAGFLAVVLVEAGSPITGFALSALSAVAALCWLAWVHHTGPRSNKPLDHVTERRFTIFAVMLLIAVSVVPVGALAADARAYFGQVSAAENHVANKETIGTRARLQSAIARMEGLGSPSVKNASAAAPDCTHCPRYFTEWLRTKAGYERGVELMPAQPTHWILGLPHIRFSDGFALFWLGLAILVILALAIWASLRGLFGFGVPLEAVEYPQLPIREIPKSSPKEWELEDGLPPRFLVIRAGERHLQALKRNAVQIDLNSDIKNARALKLPQRNPWDPRLLLIHNLGLLLGDPDSRRKALERLEQILDEQGDPPGYRIAILTSLTPLDRLLQSFERERDENDQLGEERQTTARLERAKYREDMRWSAVFEEFTTYYHAARPRPAPSDLDKEGDAVKQIWKELAYIPDHVVSAMIWDPEKPLLQKEILTWARNIKKANPEPRAIVDYLASNLIEHYHLMWSLSSRAERLLLYRIAHGHVPNVAKAYALRSLVKRGLVVLDPYPRTMNESFAQFVKHVEKPETIKDWRRTQEHGFWEGARLLFGLALPLALGVLILAAIRNGDSIVSIIPLLVAAGPALINALGSARRTAAA